MSAVPLGEGCRAIPIALQARAGAITDEELEREKGGSGLRYPFDIKSAGTVYEVGVDAQKMWVPTAAKQFLAAQLKSLQDFPPRQGADTISLKKAIDEAMQKLDNPGAYSN